MVVKFINWLKKNIMLNFYEEEEDYNWENDESIFILNIGDK